ncbi:MAG: PAS domain S-box protein [Betaproteobacteria bacterium]
MRRLIATEHGSPAPISEIGSGESLPFTGKRSPLIFSGRGLALVVLTLSLVVTLIAFDFARQEAEQHLEYRFGSAVTEISDDILERMALIEESLHGSRTFLQASKKISREEWRTFQSNQEIETYYPGTFGIGLATEIRRADADAYVRAIRRQDQNDYKIWPPGERAVYAPIRFTALHNVDTGAFGFDMYSEPRRRSAMERARDTGNPALSGVVSLVKAGEMEARESIILFLPVYKQAFAADASVEQRRASFVSYVYCPILIADFWRGLADKASQAHVAVRITDANGDTILSAPGQMPSHDHALTVSMSKNVYGQTWQFEFGALPGFVDSGLNSRAASVAAAGIAISFLLFGLFWVMTSTKLRAEAIARNMTRALRDSEGRLRKVVEQSPDAMILHQDGKIVFANHAMARLMRVADSAALIGQSARSIVHPSGRAIAERRIQELYVNKTLPLSEQVYVRADGTVVDVEVAAVSFELEAKAAALVSVRDISERKKHEAENERLRRLYAALSQINQAIVWMPTRDQLFQKICDILVEHGGFRMAWIGWHELVSHRLVPVAQSGDDGGYLQGITVYTDGRPEGQGPAGTAFRDAKPYISNDFLGDPASLPWVAQAELCGLRAVAVFPVRLKGDVHGTLTVYATETGFFQDKEISLLVDVAIDVSFALDNFAREEERRNTEAIVKRLAAIVESTDDAITAKTLQGIITDWNPAAERLFGYTAAEIIGRPIGVLIPPDRAEEEAGILVRIGQGQGIRNFETVRMRKDGQTFPVSVTISPIWGPDGAIAGATRITGASTIVRDITERVRAEAIAQTERLFSDAMIESTPGIFYLYDESGRFLRWNRNFTTVSGYSAEEIARMHPLDFFIVEDKPRVDQGIAEVFEDGESSVEAAFLSKDGRVTPYFFNGKRLLFEGSVCLVGVGIDISERKRAEEELKANEQVQRQLARQVESQRARLVEAQAVAKIGSWETELQDMHVTWSEETYRIFETDPASFQPTHPDFLAFIHPEDRARVDAAFATSLGEISSCAIEHRIVMRDGRIKIVEERWHVFRDHQGQPLRAVGTCQDITQRKEAEQALQEYARRLQAVSRQMLEVQENERRLLARELHDTVGQELTALGLNLSIVRSTIPPDLAATIGDRLQDSQKLLEDTTHHLRNVMVELRPPGIDEFGLMAALKEHARTAANRSGFELVLIGVEPKPRFPLATAMALFRIVQEALNNTVKHAQASKITIELREGPDLIVLTVADNGKGFDTMRRPLIGVYGMGMTTMRERAEAIGAHVRIDSAIGKGTRIKIEIARTSLPAAPKRPGT